MNIDEKKAENTPAGGVLIGKKDGQTIIHDEGTMSGYLVGKLHKDGGIKAVNKATGQPLEMQGGEVVITAPAVADQTKREFEGKMMTNREILSTINEKGGGVSFADGGDIPAKIHTTDCEYKLGGKVVKDTDIAHSLGMNSTLKKGKQQFSSGDSTYDVDAIYNAIKKGKLRLKTKEVETFPMKYPVYDKNYAENHKIDFRKPNGITVRTESGEEVLIDGNHRMNNAYLNGRKTMKTYYIEDPKQIAKFTKKNKFELGGENKMGGHLSKGKSLKKIAEMHNVSLAHINEELAKGLDVEKEHFSDFKERTRVAKDHLVENPDYYTILEKAGLKMGGEVKEFYRRTYANGTFKDFTLEEYENMMFNGGHIQKQELVKNSEKGDTPARDLNNYNDIMDLEADGMVGMESGLAFANGGDISKIKRYSPFPNSMDINENGDWVMYNEVKDLASFSETDKYAYVGNGRMMQSPYGDWVLYRKISYANGGITPIDANIEGDSVDIVENGFADGGGVELPIVSYVTVSGAGSSLEKLIGNRYNSYIEFAESVEDAYKQLGKKVRSFVQLQAFDENSIALIDVTTYISDQKNTILNFNPLTGNYKNLEKSLQNSRPRSFQKFNWENWLLSKVTPSSSGSGQPLDLDNTKIWIGDNPELSKRVQERAFELGWKWYDNDNAEIANLDKSNIIFFPDKDIDYLFADDKFEEYEYKGKVFKEIFPSDLGIDINNSRNSNKKTTALTSAKTFDFTDTKINVSNNPDLSQKVQKIAFENGWEWENGGGKTIDYKTFNYLYFTKTSISDGFKSSSFVNSPKREITEADIFGSQAPTTSKTSAKSITKNDVENIDYVILTDSKRLINGKEFYKGWALLRILKDLYEEITINDADVEIDLVVNGEKLLAPFKLKLKQFPTHFNEINPKEINEQILYSKLKLDWFTEKPYNWDKVFPLIDELDFYLSESYLPNFKTKNINELYSKLNSPEVKNSDKEITLSWLGEDGEIHKFGAYFTFNPSVYYQIDRTNFTIDVLREKLESWFFGRLSEDYMFPDGKAQAPISNEVTHINLSYEKNGTPTFYSGLAGGKEFIEAINSIEEANPLQDVSVNVAVNYKASNKIGGSTTEKLVENFNFGKGAFQPSNWNVYEIKSIVENDWFDGKLNFDSFFRNIVSTVSSSTITTSNSVTAISITYDSKVNINSGGISIANNPIELYQFLKGLLNGSYKNVKIQPTGNSINVNPALLYLDGSEWYGILTNNNEETALKEINKILKIIFPELNFDGFVKANSVVKTFEQGVYNLDLAVQKLEKASSSVVTEYNKEIYDKSLKFLYDTKATYELALKFTPESAFMYERLDILKKLADIEKNIKKIEDMKKGGTFYMLAKILEKLERGENWKMLEQSQDIITNQIPQSEIDIIIRSQKFKNWFGNWEKALINDEYDNVSKALTDGIPSVYHHGARRIKYTYREVSNGVLYLAENISYAMWFSQNANAQSEEGNYLTECFVNIKNPIDLTAFNVSEIDFGDLVRYIDAIYPMAKIYDFVGVQVALLIKANQPTNIKMRAWQLIRSYAKFVNHIKENTPYDGFLYYENNPSDLVTNPKTGQVEDNVTKAVAIFKSHQVKVVDAVLFDGGLDDWRFENGGKIKN